MIPIAELRQDVNEAIRQRAEELEHNGVKAIDALHIACAETVGSDYMIQIESEQQVLQEGLQILLSNMEPSKVARFWAACNIGSGDYLKLKDELFV